MSNFEQATGKSIDLAFQEFNKQNPRVWETFQEQCLRAIRLGKIKISAKQLIGYIRWDVALKTNADDGFKINDAFTSRYARYFAEKYPQYQDIFNYRELRNGKETIKKDFISIQELDILKKCQSGQIIFLNNYASVNYGNKQSHAIPNQTFNKLKNIKFIHHTEDFMGCQVYNLTQTALSYLLKRNKK